MKKDQQIINFISILKRLHKQQSLSMNKGSSLCSPRIKNGKNKKQMAESTLDMSKQSQQVNSGNKSPLPITSMSSRIYSINQKGSMYYKDSQSQLTRENIVGRNFKQELTYKKRTQPDWKTRKSEIVDNLIDSPHANDQKKQQIVFPVNFEAHCQSSFLWISPPKTKGNEFNWASADGKLQLKKQPLSLMNYCEKRDKKLNNYNKYCQEIYEKYSSRSKTYEQLSGNISECDNLQQKGWYSNKGFTRRTRFKTQIKSQPRRKQLKAIRNIDLKEIGNKVQIEHYLIQDKQEAISSQQRETELLPKLEGATLEQKVSPTQLMSFHNESSLQSELPLPKKPTLLKTKKNANVKFKYTKGHNKEGQKFETQRVWQMDEEIRIQGWQMNCNKVCSYGKVKNIISRSASIQGHDFI